MMVGVTYAMFDNKRYLRVAAKHGGNAPPEARLPPAIVGSILLPVGLFWFAWTNGNSVHWIVPIIGSGIFSAGLVLVFLCLLTYLLDSYTVFAASVLAANAVLRSLFGAAFPLFTTFMYKDLGIHWASSIPAFLALACVPFPFLFHKYGAAIRSKCKYASEAAAVLEEMRAVHREDHIDDDALAEVEMQENMLRVLQSHRSGAQGQAVYQVDQAVMSDDERTMAGNSSDGPDRKEKDGFRAAV